MIGSNCRISNTNEIIGDIILNVRSGFVSNSSTSSFIIINKTKDSLHIRDFLNENEDHTKEVLDKWDAYDIGFDQLDGYFMDDEFFNLKPGANKFEFSDDTIGSFEDNVECLMHHILEKPINSPRFHSDVFKWHIY